MNPLPVSIHGFADPAFTRRYFDDMERWGFDVAYTAFYAHAYDKVVGVLKPRYQAFVQEAKRRGFPAGIQLQSTVCCPHGFGVEEAQHYLDNRPDTWIREGVFFASFASTKWRDYLKHLTDYYVNECGFQWVVYEEPMFRTDIPGTKDRFYQLFRERYPDVPYPTRHEESEAYLLVQQLKNDLLVEFYDDLMQHAKRAGAKRVGLMPWFFIPTIENTPAETLHTACPTGRILDLPSLDFVVARMQPDNIIADVMRLGDPEGDSPECYYPEVLAHLTGKPSTAVNNPSNEHTEEYSAAPMIPLDYFKRCTLASLAAAPGGMTRHWYGKHYGVEKEHMDFMAEALRVIGRLGQPVSPVAFVFSQRGAMHARPNHYEETWKRYWGFAREWMYGRHRPALTFYTESLEANLRDNPEVRLLVLEERFPLSPEEVNTIAAWWRESPGRALVFFGSGEGFSWDLRKPGLHPLAAAAPELMRLFGVDPESPLSIRAPRTLRLTGPLFSGLEISVRSATRGLRPVAGAEVLCADESGEPVVLLRRDPTGSIAAFCGIELAPGQSSLAGELVEHLLRGIGAPAPEVATTSPRVFWNRTRQGYLVVSNCGDAPASCDLALSDGSLLWDVRRQEPVSDRALTLDPLSFALFRVVPPGSPLLDIAGVSEIHAIEEKDGQVRIRFLAGRQTTVYTRGFPGCILLDGEVAPIAGDFDNGTSRIALACSPGKHDLSLSR